MRANTKLTLIAAHIVCCALAFIGCASNQTTYSNIKISNSNYETLSFDVLNLAKVILENADFPKNTAGLNLNDSFLKKYGPQQIPNQIETINLESSKPYSISSKEKGRSDTWKIENMNLVAKKIYGDKNDTYSLLSNQLMNVENQAGTKYQLYITESLTYADFQESRVPDQGAFIIAANNSNMYVVIKDGKLVFKLDENGTGRF